MAVIRIGAGIARIVAGAFLVIIGLLFMISIAGILLLVAGIAFVAWGWDAKQREAAEERQGQMMTQQTQILQQIAMSQLAQSHQPVVTEPAPSPSLSSAPAERYCQFCGAGNSWASSYCHNCGRPLPPPNSRSPADQLPSEVRENGG